MRRCTPSRRNIRIPNILRHGAGEEGVVEQMQRLLRPDVSAALQVSINEVVVAEAEVNHPYNVYITALEDLRERLGDSQMSFYRLLLAAPLPERALLLKRSSILLADQERQSFLTAWPKAVLAFSR